LSGTGKNGGPILGKALPNIIHQGSLRQQPIVKYFFERKIISPFIAVLTLDVSEFETHRTTLNRGKTVHSPGQWPPLDLKNERESSRSSRSLKSQKQFTPDFSSKRANGAAGL
jgi:hypothetical protein